MSDVEDRLFELKAIKKTLTIAHAKALDDYLSKVITTDPRKKIWMNIDGINRQQELAEIGDIKQPSVSEFLDRLKIAGLIEYDSKNPPKRLIDHIPASWLEE